MNNNEQPTDQGLQHHIPNQLNQAMVVLDMKTWIASATLILLLGAVCLWGFFGTMELKQSATAVLIKSGRTISLYSPEDSVLLDLSIQRDQVIERDQVIARLDQSPLVEKINAAVNAGAADADIKLMRDELMRRSQVLTYDDGRVQDVFVHVGDHLTKGQKIATIIQNPPKGENLKCLMYIPMDKIHSISKGMSVNIYPDFADKNTYGNLVGTIADVSTYPASDNYLLDELGSPELAEGLTGGAACFELTISLLTSTETPTGYYWTTSNGPDIEIGDLNMCTADIILNTLRPVDVFFFKK